MQFNNFNIGDAVTVLRGHEYTCPTGCHVVGERYEDLKGVPMIVTGIEWPYVATMFPVGSGGRVIDARLCTLTKCGDEYLSGFRMIFGVKVP